MLIVTLADKIDGHRVKNKNTLFFRKRLGNLEINQNFTKHRRKSN